MLLRVTSKDSEIISSKRCAFERISAKALIDNNESLCGGDDYGAAWGRLGHSLESLDFHWSAVSIRFKHKVEMGFAVGDFHRLIRKQDFGCLKEPVI